MFVSEPVDEDDDMNHPLEDELESFHIGGGISGPEDDESIRPVEELPDTTGDELDIAAAVDELDMTTAGDELDIIPDDDDPTTPGPDDDELLCASELATITVIRVANKVRMAIMLLKV